MPSDNKAILELLIENTAFLRELKAASEAFERAAAQMDTASRSVDFDPASESARRLATEVEAAAGRLADAVQSGTSALAEHEQALDETAEAESRLAEGGDRLAEVQAELAAKFAATDERLAQLRQSTEDLSQSQEKLGQSSEKLDANAGRVTSTLRKFGVNAGEVDVKIINLAARLLAIIALLKGLEGAANVVGKAADFMSEKFGASDETARALREGLQGLLSPIHVLRNNMARLREAFSDLIGLWQGAPEPLRKMADAMESLGLDDFARRMRESATATEEQTAALERQAIAFEAQRKAIDAALGGLPELRAEAEAIVTAARDLEAAGGLSAAALINLGEQAERVQAGLARLGATDPELDRLVEQAKAAAAGLEELEEQAQDTADAVSELADTAAEIAAAHAEIDWSEPRDGMLETAEAAEELTEAGDGLVETVEAVGEAAVSAEEQLASLRKELAQLVRDANAARQRRRRETGLDDLERDQDRLIRRQEELRDATILTADEMNELDGIAGELTEVQRRLADATEQVETAFERAAREQAEAALEALELQERYQRLSEALGDAESGTAGLTDEQVRQREVLGDLEAGSERLAEKMAEVDAIADRFKSKLEELSTAAKRVATDFDAVASSGSNAFTAILEGCLEAKKCIEGL